MTNGLVSRLRTLTPSPTVALLSAGLTTLAIAAVQLVSEATFRLLGDVEVSRVRLAVLVTAALVATPVVAGLVWRAVKIQTEKHHLTVRDMLLSAAQGYAKQGHWEFEVASGQFVLSDSLHHLLGDPDRTLHLDFSKLMEMANPEDRVKVTAAFGRIISEGSPERIEYRTTGLDGQERTFWVTAARQLGPDGKPTRVFGISQDITERKAVEAALRASEDYYRHAVELSPSMSWVEDAEGNTLEVSDRWSDLTGLPVEDSLGRGWTKTIHPADLKSTESTWQQALRSGEPYDVEHRVRVVDGSYRWFRSRATARRAENGQIIRWFGSVEDIHDRKTAEISLRESEASLRESEAFAISILEGTSDCIDVMDLNRRLQFMNSSCRKLMDAYGYSVSVGQDWLELWPEDLKLRVSEAFEIAKTGASAHFNCSGLTVDGEMGFWDVNISPVRGPRGEPERLLCVSRDITAIKVAQDELEEARAAAETAARHDSLTGLLNRPAFHEQLQRQLEQTTRESQAAVLFLDLDEFKSVNDSLGHPAGDQLLRQAAQRLRTCLRGTDIIARFGGDEFAILQTAVEEVEQVKSLAQRIIDCVSEPYLLEGREVVVGTSIGVAVASAPDVEADVLLKNADIALYQAKHAGKGVSRLFESGMDEAAEEDQQLRSELREAVARGEFRIVYQPVLDFETSRVMSVEALLRWEHPRRGLLNPAEFITVAETTGDIEEIGAWVLREACAKAATWPDDVSVSVNLSPRQFRGHCLIEAVSQALQTNGIAASRLQLEITESVLLHDDQVVLKTLEGLRALGVRISIDDFGTGYSSLGYLQRFSVDNIKIDRSFVADLAENPRTSAILEAVVMLSTKLGVTLTAEGVETVAHMERLKAMGCCHGQGYLFGHAMPAEAVIGLLSKKWDNFLPQTKRHTPCDYMASS